MRTCDFCDRELTAYMRAHARFCKPSCRVMYCRHKQERSEMRKQSVNEAGQ